MREDLEKALAQYKRGNVKPAMLGVSVEDIRTGTLCIIEVNQDDGRCWLRAANAAEIHAVIGQGNDKVMGS